MSLIYVIKKTPLGVRNICFFFFCKLYFGVYYTIQSIGHGIYDTSKIIYIYWNTKKQMQAIDILIHLLSLYYRIHIQIGNSNIIIQQFQQKKTKCTNTSPFEIGHYTAIIAYSKFTNKHNSGLFIIRMVNEGNVVRWKTYSQNKSPLFSSQYTILYYYYAISKQRKLPPRCVLTERSILFIYWFS